MWPHRFKRLCRGILTLAALWFGQTSLHAHGDLHDLIAALTQRLESNPTNLTLRLERADALRRHRDFPEALADIAAAEKISPHLASLELQRARIWFDAEKFPRAITSASACLSNSPGNTDALVLRARSHARMDQHAKAVEDFSAVLQTAARPLPDLYLERAENQAALGQLENAVRGLDEGLSRLGWTPSLALPALEYERQRGAFAAALIRLGKIRPSLAPETFLALHGEINLQAGRPTNAVQDFESALRLVGKFSQARRENPVAQQLLARLQDELAKARQTLAAK